MFLGRLLEMDQLLTFIYPVIRYYIMFLGRLLEMDQLLMYGQSRKT